MKKNSESFLKWKDFFCATHVDKTVGCLVKTTKLTSERSYRLFPLIKNKILNKSLDFFYWYNIIINVMGRRQVVRQLVLVQPSRRFESFRPSQLKDSHKRVFFYLSWFYFNQFAILLKIILRENRSELVIVSNFIIMNNKIIKLWYTEKVGGQVISYMHDKLLLKQGVGRRWCIWEGK